MQIRTDPPALLKFNALIFKLRSVMSTPLAVLSPPPPSTPPPTPNLPPRSELELEDSQAAAAEVVSYFTAGLLTLTQNVLQARPAPPPPSSPTRAHKRPFLAFTQAVLSVVCWYPDFWHFLHCTKQGCKDQSHVKVARTGPQCLSSLLTHTKLF